VSAAAINPLAQLAEVANHARLLREILHTSIANGGDADLQLAAATMAELIGYISDRALGLAGWPQVLGGPEVWLLSPMARGEYEA
jgi:hypothetical protein